ncbi:fibronectin type III domain-containing protein [Laceyella putida]|uniref:Fibronectin type III domain-containing protein n=1 Tax=Laceyella putida TaxID=110101 RepID=A0ABW2RJ54_9BACL
MRFRKTGKQRVLIVAIVAVFMFSLFPAGASTSHVSAATCQEPAWNAATAYTGGTRVSYNGKIYEAKWWTQGEQPDLSGEWGPWKYIGDCGGGVVDTEAPSAPADLTVADTTSSSVSLSWKASTDNVGVSGYDVYRGATLAASTTGTTAVVTGLASNTTYSFTVKAKDAAGNVSAASNQVSATTKPGDSNEVTRRYVAYASTWNTSIYDLKPENIPNYITNVNLAFARPDTAYRKGAYEFDQAVAGFEFVEGATTNNQHRTEEVHLSTGAGPAQ